MQFSAPIMQTFFSLLLLLHYTTASDTGMIRPRAQDDHFVDSTEIFSSGDVTVDIYNNQLPKSGETTGNTEPGFEPQQQPQPQQIWLKNPPPLAGSANDDCNNGATSFSEHNFTPSRFRRSFMPHAKRQSKTFCTALPEPQTLQDGEGEPGRQGKKGPQVGQVDSDYPGTSLPIVRNIIMRTKMWGSISQKPYAEVCGLVEVPICAPFPPDRKYPEQHTTFSHFVVPIRFWEPEDPCFALIEDLWCCDTAKHPDYSHVEEMPRYPGIGFACFLVVEQLQN